ncbi:MAG: hypothetical protein JWN78_2895 [Bacteroidota bacterium]|nr:hypothetical protein [Bacteroidota bacterium]
MEYVYGFYNAFYDTVFSDFILWVKMRTFASIKSFLAGSLR